MLITNKQAIVCATVFGSMLRKGGVMTDVYELCNVDLKDFSVQGSILQKKCYSQLPFIQILLTLISLLGDKQHMECNKVVFSEAILQT